MKYEIIEFTKIPDKAIFYYLSNEGKQYKCTKIGVWGFKYSPYKGLTIRRYCPFPEEDWYCVRAIRKRK